jgi:small subunit ribosomal protein S18
MRRAPQRRERNSEEGANATANRRPFFRRRKTCPFVGKNAPVIDWKDAKLLGRYLSERGKIVPARISAVSTGKQRELATAIKRARFMALIPYLRDSGDAA